MSCTSAANVTLQPFFRKKSIECFYTTICRNSATLRTSKAHQQYVFVHIMGKILSDNLLSRLCPCFSSTAREKEEGVWQTEERFKQPIREAEQATLEQSPCFFSADVSAVACHWSETNDRLYLIKRLNRNKSVRLSDT